MCSHLFHRLLPLLAHTAHTRPCLPFSPRPHDLLQSISTSPSYTITEEAIVTETPWTATATSASENRQPRYPALALTLALPYLLNSPPVRLHIPENITYNPILHLDSTPQTSWIFPLSDSFTIHSSPRRLCLLSAVLLGQNSGISAQQYFNATNPKGIPCRCILSLPISTRRY